MPDITMNVDETLELDTIIKKSSNATVPITVTDGSDYNLNGIQTHTGIFDPQSSGDYTIKVNGQKLTIKVNDTSTVTDSGIARYNFEDDSDTNVAVDSWNGNNGSISGATYDADSQVGGLSILFDGDDDYISSTGIQFSSSDDFTIGGWIKIANTSASNQVIQSQRDSYSKSDWVLSINNTDRIQVYVGESNNTLKMYGGSVPSNSWEHVVFRKSGNTYTIFHNASSVAEKTISGGWTASESHFIGSWENGSNVFDGNLDDQRVYGGSLSDSEIESWYDNTK